jgi:hypothetical protein
MCVYNVYLSILRVSGRRADNLKYILLKWKLLVCDVSCSIPAARGTIHLGCPFQLNSGDVIDYCPNKKH